MYPSTRPLLSPIAYRLSPRQDVRHRRGGVRPGAVAGEVDRFRDQILDRAVDLADLLLLGDPVLDQPVAQHGDGVAPAPGVDLLARAVATVAHALGVRARPIG